MHLAPRKETAYLPAGRLPPPALLSDVAQAAAHPLVDAVLAAQRAAVVVVNGKRQIVASNARFLELAGLRDPGAALGLRFGETLGCTEAQHGPDGCGTGTSCASCGAAFATLAGLRGRGAERDCALRVERSGRPEDLALRVTSVPVKLSGEACTALFVSDVTAERSRVATDRTALGDVTRLAGDLRSALGTFRTGGGDDDLGRAASLADLLQGELAVTALLAGEPLPAGGFPPSRPLEVRAVVRRLAAALRAHPAAGGRTVEVDPTPPGARVDAEPASLHRALLAAAVNALEATRPGGTVRIAVAEGPHETALRVWNAGAIPAVVLPRLFQRHFTTKGSGRGQGMWGMKLLVERILGGEVQVSSSAEDGTWVSVEVPRG